MICQMETSHIENTILAWLRKAIAAKDIVERARATLGKNYTYVQKNLHRNAKFDEDDIKGAERKAAETLENILDVITPYMSELFMRNDSVKTEAIRKQIMDVYERPEIMPMENGLLLSTGECEEIMGEEIMNMDELDY